MAGRVRKSNSLTNYVKRYLFAQRLEIHIAMCFSVSFIWNPYDINDNLSAELLKNCGLHPCEKVIGIFIRHQLFTIYLL